MTPRRSLHVCSIEELLSLAAGDDEEAWCELINRVYPAIFPVVCRIVSKDDWNTHDIEEAVNDAFIYLWNGRVETTKSILTIINKGPDEESPSDIFRSLIVWKSKCLLIDKYKKNKSKIFEPLIGDRVLSAQQICIQAIQTHETIRDTAERIRTEIKKLVPSLDQTDLEMIIAGYCYGIDHETLQQMFGISKTNTVTVRLKRARDEISKTLRSKKIAGVAAALEAEIFGRECSPSAPGRAFAKSVGLSPSSFPPSLFTGRRKIAALACALILSLMFPLCISNRRSDQRKGSESERVTNLTTPKPAVIASEERNPSTTYQLLQTARAQSLIASRPGPRKKEEQLFLGPVRAIVKLKEDRFIAFPINVMPMSNIVGLLTNTTFYAKPGNDRAFSKIEAWTKTNNAAVSVMRRFLNIVDVIATRRDEEWDVIEVNFSRGDPEEDRQRVHVDKDRFSADVLSAFRRSHVLRVESWISSDSYEEIVCSLESDMRIPVWLHVKAENPPNDKNVPETELLIPIGY